MEDVFLFFTFEGGEEGILSASLKSMIEDGMCFLLRLVKIFAAPDDCPAVDDCPGYGV